MFLTSAFCKPTLIVEKEKAATTAAATPKDENFSLSEFLRNHKEVSISVHAKASRGVADEDDVIFVKEEKRFGRKQQQPRRTNPEEPEAAPPLSVIEPLPSADRQQINDIQDKHLIRLTSRKLCCRICQYQERFEDMENSHYHSKTSLMLHHRWRHGSRPATRVQCKLCRANFDRRYKLVLHRRLHHSRRHHRLAPSVMKPKQKSKKAVPADSRRKKTAPSKKQRKRKPKGRSGGAKSSSGKRRNK